MSLPYYPLFPKDFEAKTSHLTMIEDGAYNRLLRLCWMTPGCSLPDDEDWIMRRVRAATKAERDAVRVVLSEFFVRKSKRLHQPNMTKQALLADEAHQRRVNAGLKGGRKSKPLENNNSDASNAKVMPKQPEPEPEPEIRKEANASLADADAPAFADFWKAWPLGKVQKAKAEAAFKRLSAENRRRATSSAEAWAEAWRKKYPTASDLHPTTYLNGKRWEDDFVTQLSAPTDIRSALAARIRSGKDYLVRDITPATARELVAAGLVTEAECRKAGIA